MASRKGRKALINRWACEMVRRFALPVLTWSDGEVGHGRSSRTVRRAVPVATTLDNQLNVTWPGLRGILHLDGEGLGDVVHGSADGRHSIGTAGGRPADLAVWMMMAGCRCGSRCRIDVRLFCDVGLGFTLVQD
jgi:hypothetical protein